MRFTGIQLLHFRGFSGKHEIVLHPELTVLAGLNGSGKSSVLDAAASVMSGAVSWIAGGNASWFGGGDTSNIHSAAETAEWQLDWHGTENRTVGSGRLWASFSPTYTKSRTESKRGTESATLTSLRNAVPDLNVPLPYFGYIHSSSTRAAVELQPRGVTLKGRLLAYAGAFDTESVQFDALSAWFEQEENLENQEKIRSGNLNRSLPSLRAVRKAVQRFLSKLHGSRLHDLTVLRSRGANPLEPAAGRLAITKDGHQLFIEQLSDGERRLILLVADTARRMVVLNPKMEDALETEGLLLLDEIELHLHPQWQRTVIAAIRAAFPRLQFVFATHAPAVLATVPNECVVVLDDGKVLPGTPQVFGRDPNTILSTVMDTPLRPDDVQVELDALFSELDAHPRKAKNRLKKLEERLGADDPDLVRARALMRFMAG